MARSFDDGSNEYIALADNAAFDTDSYSVSCWWDFDDPGASDGTNIAISRDSGNAGDRYFNFGPRSSDNDFQIEAWDSGDAQTFATGGTSSGGFKQYTFIYDQSDITLYENNSSVLTSARANGAKQGAQDINIGGQVGAFNNHYNGSIAEAAMWNRVLTSAERQILADRYSPLFIPSGLLWYTPLMGRADPEPELILGISTTLTNTPTTSNHPAIIYPTSKQIRRFGGVSFKPHLMAY